MQETSLRLFQVVEKKAKNKSEVHYFTLKQKAKAKRNELKQDQKDVHVSYGPDHDKHVDNRAFVGWNKGKHPKKDKGKKWPLK